MKAMKLLIVQPPPPPPSCHLHPLMSKYSPQLPILKHTQSVFLP
jgi:hypothetical protein